MQMLVDLVRDNALHDLLLTNRKDLVANVVLDGSLGFSQGEKVQDPESDWEAVVRTWDLRRQVVRRYW